jgi:Heterokaryon incompatibility protein (HET)
MSAEATAERCIPVLNFDDVIYSPDLHAIRDARVHGLPKIQPDYVFQRKHCITAYETHQLKPQRKLGHTRRGGANEEQGGGAQVTCPICKLIRGLLDNRRPQDRRWVRRLGLVPEDSQGLQFPRIEEHCLEGLIILFDDQYKGPTRLQHPQNWGRNFSYGLDDSSLVMLPLKGTRSSTIQDWLRRCETHHGSFCGRLDAMDVDNLQIFLVDVQELCIARYGCQDQRYLALSYVWGTTDKFQCVKGNLDTLCEPRGLEAFHNEIPQTVQDAISLTKSFGERYIWIDTLCIVQDDTDHKAEQIAKMANIYGNSVLTILAAGSDNAASGIPCILDHGRNLDTFPVPNYPGLHCTWRDDFVADYYESRHSQRGWTFQERLMAPRCLYLLRGQVYFQCRNATWSEDRDGRLDDGQGTRLLSPMANLSGDTNRSDSRRPSAWKTDALQFANYLQIVHEYLDKALTNPSDIANAFAGISDLIGRWYGWNFVHGLPMERLDAALLWCAVDQKPQRRLSVTAAAGKRTQKPSWSWMGWLGQITYEWTILWGGDLTPLITKFALEARSESRNGAGKDFLCFRAMTSSLRQAFHAQPPKKIYWKPPNLKRQLRTTEWTYLTILTDSAGAQCGCIYGDIENVSTSKDDLKLVVLSSLRYTPRLPYLHYSESGICLHDHGGEEPKPDDAEHGFRTIHHIYDEDIFEPREGATLNFLVVKDVSRGEGLERVGVGHIHADAWLAIGFQETDIRLF